jgi:hypothetical protein
MFWILPSWLNYLTFWDILPILAYILALALIESLLILGLVVLLAVLLPGKFFKDQFIPQGSLVVIIFTIVTLLLHGSISLAYSWSPRQVIVYSLLIWVSVILFTVVVSYLLIHRIKALENFFSAVADRVTVFLYIYVPLGVLSLVVAILRNIF